MKDHNCPSRQNKCFFTLQSCKTYLHKEPVERKNAKLQHVPHPGTFILIYTCHASRNPSFVNNSLRLNNCLYITTSEHDIFNSRPNCHFPALSVPMVLKFLLTNINIAINIITYTVETLTTVYYEW